MLSKVILDYLSVSHIFHIKQKFRIREQLPLFFLFL